MKGTIYVTLLATFLSSGPAFAQSNPAPQSGASDSPNFAATNASASDQTQFRWLSDPKAACSARTLESIPADAISWAGACIAGVVNGPGTLSLWNKGAPVESISAAFDRGTLVDGHVSIKWPDGSSYDGNALAGQMDGQGTLTTRTGDRFEGQWKSGQLNGYGSAVWANGDRYDGDWRDGKADGRGVQVWADGHKYDGEWRNDEPNGHGIVTERDGTRFEGEFADGRPRETAALASPAVYENPAASPSTPAASSDDAASGPTPQDRSASSGGKSSARASSVGGVAGKKLVAVDGSSLTLAITDDGLARQIVAPNGSSKKETFDFLSDSLGTVSGDDENGKVTGVFRVTDKGLVTNYGDGRSEILSSNAQGGVTMTVNAPTGASLCMAWYPEGHQFSIEERKAAVAEYASRLGVDSSSHKGAKPAKSSCAADGATANATAAARQAAAPTPIPRHHLRSAHSPVRTGSIAPSAMPASFIMPPGDDNQGSIDVRPSVVHTIDSPAHSAASGDQVVGGQSIAALPGQPDPVASASTCLSVESDGEHWGFRNRCSYNVQFVYCLKNADDPLTSCGKAAVSGSVSPRGTTALVADRSLSETNSDHDFRWVACGGGAGEVVVHLDQSDPPAGRCERPSRS